eukprot:5195123-Alexandrium_andersonii.AAC.1
MCSLRRPLGWAKPTFRGVGLRRPSHSTLAPRRAAIRPGGSPNTCLQTQTAWGGAPGLGGGASSAPRP